MSRLDRLLAELLVELRRFDPALLSGSDSARMVTSLARTEKALAAARAQAALRASECGAHRDEGFASASDWLARQTGTTARAAGSELDTARTLRAHPETWTAAAVGEISTRQAAEIVRTVSEVPDAEGEMLELAKTGGFSRLTDEGRKRRAAAVRREELHDKQCAAREVVHWRDELGMICGRFRLTPDVGVRFVNRLDRETGRRVRDARRAGDDDPRGAHAADAFAAMISGSANPHPAKVRPVDLVVVCDLNAWRRGHVHGDEVCHIVGGGPIPVVVARNLAEDAFLKAVLHDGVNIHTVTHFGRRIPAELRTALDLGPLPSLDGVVCVEEGCDRRYGLEWDHVDPVANGGPTIFENLKPRCKVDHWDKTERDRRTGLLRAATGRVRGAGREADRKGGAQDARPPP